jgi:hypothetical protein
MTVGDFDDLQRMIEDERGFPRALVGLVESSEGERRGRESEMHTE